MHDIQKNILKLAEKQYLKELSLRNVSKIVGAKYAQQVKHHYQQLIRKGLLTEDLKLTKSSSVYIDKENNSFVDIPVLNIRLGEAMGSSRKSINGYLLVSNKVMDSNDSFIFFAFKMQNDSELNVSYKGEKIEGGDYVIIGQSGRKPQSGDFVFTTIDGKASLRKLIRDVKRKLLVLLPLVKNDTPPIILHQSDVKNYKTIGEVVKVIKGSENYLKEIL